mgnify:CR=1 FL=1
MARTPEHSDDKILAVCEALASEGHNVTNLSVRERLGGGAFSRIAPIVKEFKSQSVPERQEVVEVESDDLIPSDIKESFLGALRGVVLKIQTDANQQIAESERRSKLAISSAEQATGEAEAENKKFEVIVLDLEARAEKAETALESAKKKIEALEKKVLKLKSENDAFKFMEEKEKPEVAKVAAKVTDKTAIVP